MELHCRGMYISSLSFLIKFHYLKFELAPYKHDKQPDTCSYPELATTPETRYKRIQNLWSLHSTGSALIIFMPQPVCYSKSDQICYNDLYRYWRPFYS